MTTTLTAPTVVNDTDDRSVHKPTGHKLQYRPPKERHGCLTAYLAVVTFLTVILALLVFSLGAQFASFGLMLLVNLVGFAGVWMWKKWGFWVVVATTALGVVITATTFPEDTASSAVQAVISLGIFYGVLQIGQRNQGWRQLD